MSVCISGFSSAASVVTIESNTNGYTLLYNGVPYFVNESGGQKYLESVTRSGGNSVRTWGVNDWVLDSAKAHGPTVTMGLWDPTATSALSAVAKYKDHDALLAWVVGNEMEARTSDPVTLFKNLNAIALQMKQADCAVQVLGLSCLKIIK